MYYCCSLRRFVIIVILIVVIIIAVVVIIVSNVIVVIIIIISVLTCLRVKHAQKNLFKLYRKFKQKWIEMSLKDKHRLSKYVKYIIYK